MILDILRAALAIVLLAVLVGSFGMAGWTLSSSGGLLWPLPFAWFGLGCVVLIVAQKVFK